MQTSNDDIAYLKEYGDSYVIDLTSVPALVADTDQHAPITQMWINLLPYFTDDAIRRCPSCQTMFLEDPVIYENPNLCPACGLSITTRRPLNY